METEIRFAQQHRRILKRGKIVFNSYASVFDCAIAKVDANGAELLLDSSLGVPARFELRLDLTKEAFPCVVVTRTETSLSVKFERPLQPARPRPARTTDRRRDFRW